MEEFDSCYACIYRTNDLKSDGNSAPIAGCKIYASHKDFGIDKAVFTDGFLFQDCRYFTCEQALIKEALGEDYADPYAEFQTNTEWEDLVTEQHCMG